MITPPPPIEERLQNLPQPLPQSVRDQRKLLALSSCFQQINHRDRSSGACSHCGSCCTRVLPIEHDKELPKIRKYLQKHPELKEYILRLNDKQPSMLCPFLDFTQATCKCMIYGSGVLPAICKDYTCDPDIRPGKIQFIRDTHPGYRFTNMDMWYTLFRKGTGATNITPAWEDMLLLNGFGAFLSPEVRMYPDNFVRFFHKEFSWKEFMTNELGLILPDNILNGTEADARNFLRY